MPTPYETLDNPRFKFDTVDGYDQITIPAQRSYFVMAFLLFWLCGWTLGGLSTIHSLMTKGFQPFLFFWLGGWLFGECMVLAVLAWQLTGAEILRLVGTDLEVGYRILGLTRRKLYRGADIRDFVACDARPLGQSNQLQLPVLMSNKFGTAKFAYGARTVYLAAGLDEAEGQIIVESLRKRLQGAV